MSITIPDLVTNPSGISSSDIAYKDTNVGAALDGKQDKLTFDTTPTASSTNPVTSGGVKTALDGKQDAGKYAVYNGSGQVSASISTLTNERVQIVANKNDESWVLLQIAAQAKQLSIITKDATGDPVTRATFTADEDTGWVQAGASTDLIGSGGAVYRKKNGVVWVRFWCTGTFSIPKGWATLFTLPVGIRPANGQNPQLNVVYRTAADGKWHGDIYGDVDTASGAVRLTMEEAITQATWNTINAMVSFPV